MTGPEGCYRLTYSAGNETDSVIEVEIAGQTMRWAIETVTRTGEGVSLSGMTSGTQAIWQDQFWFEFFPDAEPPRIDYWGDRVLWRTDLHDRA